MQLLWKGLYRFILQPAMAIAARLLAGGSKKLAETLAGQQGWQERLGEQMRARQPGKQLVWFHVASAGEYLQAMPVMERLMLRGQQCALTVTSVSGYRWATRNRRHRNLVAIEYFPLDTRRNVNQLLDMIQPTAVVYVKFDLWPNLIWETRRRDIPQFLISATLHEQSKRVTSAVARSLYHSLYRCLDGIFTVSDDDTRRFLQTCPEHPNVHTVGDTRFDSVLDRKAAISPPELPEAFKQQTALLVGSCWPEDETQIFPAIREALQHDPQLQVIIAPHEVDETHLRHIEKAFADYPLQRFSQWRDSDQPARLLLVDTVGHLSSLYFYADLAYVGGAFGRGVHNTMEPSAMGVPAIFGPFYQNSPEAMELVAHNKAFSIQNGDEFKTLLLDLLNHPEKRQQAGKNAANYIEDQAGASDACFKLIEDVLQ